MSSYFYPDGQSAMEIARMLILEINSASAGKCDEFVLLDDVVCGKVKEFHNWIYMLQQLQFALDPRESEVL